MTTIGKVLEDINKLMELSKKFTNTINILQDNEDAMCRLKTLGLHKQDLIDVHNILNLRAYQLKDLVNKTNIDI